jgi:hypothetical protein
MHYCKINECKDENRKDRQMSLELTQQESDKLLGIEKFCQDDRRFVFSDVSGSLRIQLISKDSSISGCICM